MRAKYNFHDHKGNRGPLPEDINQILREFTAKLESPSIDKIIDEVQEKRLFGEATAFDARNIIVCKIQFDSGVCRKFDIVRNPEDSVLVKPVRAIFLQSIKNDMVDFKPKAKE